MQSSVWRFFERLPSNRMMLKFLGTIRRWKATRAVHKRTIVVMKGSPMPRFRKLSEADIAAPRPTAAPRAALAHAYDAHLAGFAPGDYGRVEVFEDERRAVVRRQLQAAAGRRGFVLRFRSGPGPLTFRVAAAGPTPPQEPVQAAAPRDESALPASAAPHPPRPPRRRQPAGRYDDVLPRWKRSSPRHPCSRAGSAARSTNWCSSGRRPAPSASA